LDIHGNSQESISNTKYPKNAANTAIEYYLLSVGYWIFMEIAKNQYPTLNIQKNAANTAIEYYLLSVGYWIFTERTFIESIS